MGLRKAGQVSFRQSYLRSMIERRLGIHLRKDTDTAVSRSLFPKPNVTWTV